MQHRQTLIHHAEIQNWVTARRGMPAFTQSAGQPRARLALSFSGPRQHPMSASSLDNGMSPVSWKAWLAELDRQRLALSVKDGEFEFVERDEAVAESPLDRMHSGLHSN